MTQTLINAVGEPPSADRVRGVAARALGDGGKVSRVARGKVRDASLMTACSRICDRGGGGFPHESPRRQQLPHRVGIGRRTIRHCDLYV